MDIIISPNKERQYQKQKYLGKGSFGVVYGVTDEGGKKYAAKEIEMPSGEDEVRWKNIHNEIEVLRDLNHPSLLSLEETFTHNDVVVIIMEFASGTTLHTLMISRGFSERDGSEIASHLLNPLKYLHSKGIVHRDIKPENIMVLPTTPTSHSRSCKCVCVAPHPCCFDCGGNFQFRVKIVDFGSAKICSPSKYNEEGSAATPVGTSLYLSSDLIHKYSTGSKKTTFDDLVKGDIFALGITVFVMLCRMHPFNGSSVDSLEAMATKIEQGMDIPDDLGVSESAVSWFSNLLAPHPSHRPTAAKALCHDWIIHRNIHSAPIEGGIGHSSCSTFAGSTFCCSLAPSSI
eukprot:TRINITY_DN4142_c0_g1_i1.p1 TRINITY_DN4142_c0_g1~~TRINITY_DN4142_c0_g1_i1.p1  ORF type:complete len:389 (+),score=78.29 TRINITY_DN4142_c0_g1_i1:134-1168(+)